MKKLILLSFIVMSFLSSCESGCGCPGGAGYGQNKTQNTEYKA